jgi:hypothetical protein
MSKIENMILKIFKYFSRPSLPRVKILLFPVLVLAVCSDIQFGYDFVSQKLSVKLGSGPVIISYLLIGTFIYIICYDYLDRRKYLIKRNEKIELLKDPNISDTVKIKIIEDL